MPCRRTRGLPAIAAAALVAALPACASRPEETTTYAPPPASVREHLGAIAVVPVKCDATYVVATPAKGGGAGTASGAGQGALWGATPGMLFCATGIGCLLGAPAALAGAIVGAIPGALVGAGKAHSAEEVTASEALLRQIITETPADEKLADLIAAKAGQAGFPARVERVDKAATPDDLAAKGFTSALMISVLLFDFVGRSGMVFDETPIEPSASLFIGVAARIDRPGESNVWSREWAYHSEMRPFFAWAANDARSLREDINTGLNAVATRVVADIFVSDAPEIQIEPDFIDDIEPGVARPVLSCVRRTPRK